MALVKARIKAPCVHKLLAAGSSDDLKLATLRRTIADLKFQPANSTMLLTESSNWFGARAGFACRRKLGFGFACRCKGNEVKASLFCFPSPSFCFLVSVFGVIFIFTNRSLNEVYTINLILLLNVDLLETSF